MPNRIPPTPPKRPTMSGKELERHRQDLSKLGMRKNKRISKPKEWTAEDILNYNAELEQAVLQSGTTLVYRDEGE